MILNGTWCFVCRCSHVTRVSWTLDTGISLGNLTSFGCSTCFFHEFQNFFHEFHVFFINFMIFFHEFHVFFMNFMISLMNFMISFMNFLIFVSWISCFLFHEFHVFFHEFHDFFPWISWFFHEFHVSHTGIGTANASKIMPGLLQPGLLEWLRVSLQTQIRKINGDSGRLGETQCSWCMLVDAIGAFMCAKKNNYPIDRWWMVDNCVLFSKPRLECPSLVFSHGDTQQGWKLQRNTFDILPTWKRHCPWRGHGLREWQKAGFLGIQIRSPVDNETPYLTEAVMSD